MFFRKTLMVLDGKRFMEKMKKLLAELIKSSFSDPFIDFKDNDLWLFIFASRITGYVEIQVMVAGGMRNRKVYVVRKSLKPKKRNIPSNIKQEIIAIRNVVNNGFHLKTLITHYRAFKSAGQLAPSAKFS
jgi:hypothetical protein